MSDVTSRLRAFVARECEIHVAKAIERICRTMEAMARGRPEEVAMNRMAGLIRQQSAIYAPAHRDHPLAGVPIVLERTQPRFEAPVYEAPKADRPDGMLVNGTIRPLGAERPPGRMGRPRHSKAPEMVEMLAQGVPPKEIAHRLAVSLNTVYTAAKRARDTGDTRIRHRAHKQDEVLEAWQTGMTAVEIARKLGRTREAVYIALSRAKRRGDPRAVRPPGWSSPPTDR